MIFTPKLAGGVQTAAATQLTTTATAVTAHHVQFMPQASCDATPASRCAAATDFQSDVDNVTYHGGPVIHSAVNYLIFWLPTGYGFDSPTTDVGYPSSSDQNYQALIERYFTDVSDTGYYSVIQQYTDSSGSPGLATTLGGTWLDSFPYPSSEGSITNPIQDSDIQAEVTRAIAANGWNVGNGNHEFFVFTGYDAYVCAGSECSYNGLCSYHSSFNDTKGEDVVYADVPDPGNHDVGTCMATQLTGLQAPNGAAFADSAVNLVAHEELESVTDPLYDGWYYQDVNHEIADECVWMFGSVSPDGSNVALNGHKYLLQEMWSDDSGGCVLPASAPTLQVSVGYQVKDGSGPAPTFTFFSGGVLEKRVLSNSPQTFTVDSDSFWSVAGTIEGSLSGERWQTQQAASGFLKAGETTVFTYYHQFLVGFGFEVFGGGFPQYEPMVNVTQFGSTSSVTAKGAGFPIWVDAQSSYSYPTELVGSISTERWMAQSVGGSVSSQVDLTVQYRHQYLVSFAVTDASGATTVVPTLLQVDSKPNGTVDVQGSSQWLDAGSSFVVGQVLWEGADVKPLNQTFTVDAPQNVVIDARIYPVTLKVTDYLGQPVSGAVAHIEFYNGTTATRTTATDGTISLAATPLGRLNGTLSYLGASQVVSVDASAQQGQTDFRIFASWSDYGVLAVVVVIATTLVVYALIRRR